MIKPSVKPTWPCGVSRVAVQAEAVIGPGEALEQAVREHRPGTAAHLLRGLGDEDERALPAVLEGGERAGRADPAGHVHVVAAGVHDADFVALLVARPHLAGVGQAGLLDDRQGVHVGADQDGRPGRRS